jgi:hypothetical protein
MHRLTKILSLTKILKSFRFWLAIIILPFVLLGCATHMLDFESDFISDAFVARKTVTTQINGKAIELSYLRAGDPDGQRVIFVHGTPGDAGGNWYNLLKNVP